MDFVSVLLTWNPSSVCGSTFGQRFSVSFEKISQYVFKRYRCVQIRDYQIFLRYI